MQLSKYRLLPDYMKPAEVEKYSMLILRESSLETVSQTLAKLRDMADRQSHTYELPSRNLQDELKKWLIQNWTTNADEYLESVMVLSYCFGLDKRFFRKALSLYQAIRGMNFSKT